MSGWIGIWDVEQKAIVGTFPMVMTVTGSDATPRVEFQSERVHATVLDVTVDGEKMRIDVDLRKPMKAKAVMELELNGPDSLTGVGKIKFLPNSSYRGTRRTSE